jgi:hypothetical protein
VHPSFANECFGLDVLRRLRIGEWLRLGEELQISASSSLFSDIIFGLHLGLLIYGDANKHQILRRRARRRQNARNKMARLKNRANLNFLSSNTGISRYQISHIEPSQKHSCF